MKKYSVLWMIALAIFVLVLGWWCAGEVPSHGESSISMTKILIAFLGIILCSWAFMKLFIRLIELKAAELKRKEVSDVSPQKNSL